LPTGIVLVVRDAYRPISVQRQIYHGFITRFKKEYSDWSEERIKEEVDKYVAEPDSPIPPGHTTGGAVDVSLAYKKNGKRLAMKSSKVPYGEQTVLHNPKLPKNVLRNRRILYDAMLKAGFSNYSHEWWHYSFGDVFDAARTGKKVAIFGGV
jgi:D-alanyl-D-alanine dipeptidase